MRMKPGSTFPDHAVITKSGENNFENVAARIALRHREIFAGPRNPFTAV
jgi:hypothetical protein